jgi:prepilin-type N-terminal cleavage/methylation domain-containing protein
MIKTSFSFKTCDKGPSLFPKRPLRDAFSLVELLTVLTIISIVTAFAIPAFTVRDADNISNGSYAISGTLQRARAYAMAHNTYVWVGFYEEAADAPAPTNVFPYSGKGRVVIGMVASVDGTQIIADGATGTLDPTRIYQIDKLARIQNIHVADLGLPTGGATAISNRPKGAYFNASNDSYSPTELYGISSDSGREHDFFRGGLVRILQNHSLQPKWRGVYRRSSDPSTRGRD